MTSFQIFEDERWVDFYPLSSTRHLAQQILGTRTLLEHLASELHLQPSLRGRGYLAAVVREETGLAYNESLDERTLVINARLNPLVDLKKMIAGKSGFALFDRGSIAVATIGKNDLEAVSSEDGTLSQDRLQSLAAGLDRLESTEPILFRYPWEVLEANENALRGKNSSKPLGAVEISQDAKVEESVVLDPSLGPITVAAGARIESFSRLSGPCYVGPGTTLHSALVRRGTSICEECRIGGEVEQSIVYPHTNKAHHGYLGHSIVGEWVNVGAGSTTSDLKNTYGTVRVERTSGRVDSGLQKLGAMIGDMAKISIGTMIYAGKTVGISAHCSGLVDRDVSDFTSYDGYRETSFELTLKSVTETMGRMMARRDATLSASKKALIEHLYTKVERMPAATRKEV